MSLLIKINNIMRFRYAPHLRGNFLLAVAIVPVHESYTKNKKSQFYAHYIKSVNVEK